MASAARTAFLRAGLRPGDESIQGRRRRSRTIAPGSTTAPITSSRPGRYLSSSNIPSSTTRARHVRGVGRIRDLFELRHAAGDEYRECDGHRGNRRYVANRMERIERSSGGRPRHDGARNSVPAHEIQMHSDQHDQDGRKEDHVGGVPSAERQRANLAASLQQVHQPRSHDGRESCDLDRHHGGPGTRAGPMAAGIRSTRTRESPAAARRP